VKATTNRRLTVLRAMFNFLVKRGAIQKSDVPAFPIANNVDNKRRGYLDTEDMEKLLKASRDTCTHSCASYTRLACVPARLRN